MKFVIIFHILFFPTRTKWVYLMMTLFFFSSLPFFEFLEFLFFESGEMKRRKITQQQQRVCCVGGMKAKHHQQPQYQNEYLWRRIHNHKKTEPNGTFLFTCTHVCVYSLYCAVMAQNSDIAARDGSIVVYTHIGRSHSMVMLSEAL